MIDGNVSASALSQDNNGDAYYQRRQKRHLLRLFLLYLVPLVLLMVYVYFQFDVLIAESGDHHMRSVAEYEAKMLDLFLSERVANLRNLINDPSFPRVASTTYVTAALEKLQRDSDTFIDIGFFNAQGVQAAYAGPVPALELRNYSGEAWYQVLASRRQPHVITDIYLGFRREPHFTIGVSRETNGGLHVLRATLAPARIYAYITSIEGSRDVDIALINRQGLYQVVTPSLGQVLQPAGYVPPEDPPQGIARLTDTASARYAYAWLTMAPWVAIVRPRPGSDGGMFHETRRNSLWFAGVLFIAGLAVIFQRAHKLTESEREKDIVTRQLVHASKLASVGELASGIAHEINNPLAIIASDAGLMKDLMNPDFKTDTQFRDLEPYINDIQDAAFRCRDITRRLLQFVRKNELTMEAIQVNTLIDELIDGFFAQNSATFNIEIIKDYAPILPDITTDGNQIKQVFLNILTNAVDAITPPGSITIRTRVDNNRVLVSFLDTGAGMTEEQMAKIFLPFFTTKMKDKGTGLGLPVSLGIVEHLGGKIEVESVYGRGSTFTVVLPVRAHRE